MPSQTEELNFYKDLNIKSEKFADFNTLLKFPKQCITSKMFQLSGDKDEFIVTCLKNHPISLVKDHKIQFPIYEKNDLIPLKPIQNLHSCAESSEALIMSHGDRCLEFGRIKSFEEDSIISRFCQKIVERPYTKLSFNTENSFIGFCESQIDFYDFKRITRLGYTTTRSRILDLDYCQKEPSIFAFTNGELNIIDIREGWNLTNTLYKQKNSSKFLKWNPHVPYWLATATSDALEIFDIRYNSSTPVLNIQHSNIQDLCWSPTNCDLILAASRDRRINLWSLGRAAEDCRLSMTLNQFELGSLCASKQSAHMFYGLDDSDSLINIKVRSDYLNSIVPHQSNDPDYQDIEEALYNMDLLSFKEKLSQISQATFENSNSSLSYNKLKELVLLTMPSESCSSKSFVFDKTLISSIEMKMKNEKLSAFKLFLAQCNGINYQILKNPLFMKQDGNSSEFQEFIEQLRLKIRIVELLDSNDFVTLKKFINLISEAYLKNSNFLDKFQSIKLFALIMKNDRGDGFELLLRLCSAYPIGRPQFLQVWIWMSFYPTIFDTKSYELIKIRPAALSKSINDMKFEENENEQEIETDHVAFLEKIRDKLFISLLENPEINNQNIKIIHQLNLNIGNNPMTLKKLIENEFKLNNQENTNEIPFVLSEIQKELFEEKCVVCIISGVIIKSLLEITLKNSSTSYLADFFQTAFRLQILTEKTPIGPAITEFITATGFSRLKLLISHVTTRNFRVSTNENILKAIKEIKRISTDPYSSLSDEQINYLTNSMKLLQYKLK